MIIGHDQEISEQEKKNKKNKKEKYVESLQKSEVRALLLRDFQEYCPGSFFILEGPNCSTIKHIEKTWTNYPIQLDIANYGTSTTKQIQKYIKKNILDDIL